MSVYVDQKELEKIYVLAECKVLACCLFEKLTIWYDQFRFLQITSQLPINVVHQYAGYLVSRDYVYLIKELFEQQAPLFWSDIKCSLGQELFFQRKHDLSLFIKMY